MPVTWSHRLRMWFRQSPVDAIVAAFDAAEASSLDVTLEQLETHARAGGNPVKIVESLRLAAEYRIDTSFNELCYVDLMTKHDLIELIEECMVPREHTFDTYAEGLDEAIVGSTRDGTKVSASCSFRYRPPVGMVLIERMKLASGADGKTPWVWRPADVQERLSARIAVLINAAASFTELELKRSEHEASAGVLGQRLLPSLDTVRVTYRREAPGQ